METAKCPLCGGESRIGRMFTIDGAVYDLSFCQCPGCGKYVFDDFLSHKLKETGDDAPFRLACLLREHVLSGERRWNGLFSGKTEPGENTIDKHLARWWEVDELLSQFPNATEIIDRSLLNLRHGGRIKHPMDCVKYSYDELQFLMFCPTVNLRNQISGMKQMGLLAPGAYEPEAEICISPAGWQRIDELSKVRPDSRQAFVAMWFDTCMDPLFEDGMVPAIKRAGFEPRCIDAKEHNNKICDEIVAEIRKSRFIIADFTAGCCKGCETCADRETCQHKVRARGGVYFEAGFAMGLGIPVIWTVRKDQIEQVHFDTRQYNHIVYESAEDLESKLYNRIAATIH